MEKQHDQNQLRYINTYVMKLCTYQISRVARLDEDIIYQWKIDMTFVPSWAERVLLGRSLAKRRTLVGSCDNWSWKSGSVHKAASVRWRLWAQYRLKAYKRRHNQYPTNDK
jgi:hypothetical protein